MPKKVYAPVCSDESLLSAQEAINTAETAEQLREAIKVHGPKVGYKAFSWIASRKVTAEQLIANKHGEGSFGDDETVGVPQAGTVAAKAIQASEEAEQARKAKFMALLAQKKQAA